MVKPIDHVARRTFRIEAARHFAPGIALSAAFAAPAICVGEDIAALAHHRPVRIRKLMRNGDVVHDPSHARGLISNRLRRLAL